MPTKWIAHVMMSIVLVLFMVKTIIVQDTLWMQIAMVTLTVVLVVGVCLHAREIANKTPSQDSLRNHVFDGLYVVMGAIMTYALSLLFGIHAVTASALVGLLAHVFLKRHEVAIYCGSFAGMTSVMLIRPLEFVLVAVLAGLVFVLLKPVYQGFGGKLGTIAFIGSVTTYVMLGKDFATIILLRFNLVIFILVAVIGAILPWYIQHRIRPSAVFASAAPSLLMALLFIPLLTHGDIYATVFFAASFAGMASIDRLPNLFWAGIAGLVCGLLFYGTFIVMNGAGGKLGTIAVLSVIVTWVLANAQRSLFKQKTPSV